MPRKPGRPCSHPGCPEVVTDGSRCTAHKREQFKRKTAARMQDERVREDKRFYDSALWRKVRAQVLRQEPFCRECAKEGKPTLAEMVDHIQPISQGGPRTNHANLQPLCHACHNVKRQKESRLARGDADV